MSAFIPSRRTFNALLAATPIMLATGCGKPARDGNPMVAVITPSHDNPFFKAEADAAAARLRELGYSPLVNTHDDDPYRQSQLIDVAIARKVVAIILDNAGSDATLAAVSKAKTAGIPSVLIDREMSGRGIAIAKIVADNYQGAMLGADAFAREMGEAGDYVELIGRESDTNASIRSQGFHEVLGRYPGLTLVGRQSANWSQTEAFTRMETLIQGHRNLKGVIAGNDTMALGALAALKAAGLGEVIVVGFDGSPDALASIRAGALKATVLQPAVRIAQMAAQQVHDYLSTGATGLPEKQAVPCELVDQGNVDEYGVFARKIQG